MSNLTGDQIRDAIAAVTSGAVENKRNFTETIELQRNYDPQKDERFSGSVKLPHIPRPKMKVGDAQHVEEMDSDTVDLEVDKLPDIDDDHSIKDGDVIMKFRDDMGLDKLLSSFLRGCRDKPENDNPFSGRDPEYEDIDMSDFQLFHLEYESKKRDEDESGREEDIGNDENIEQDTKRQFGNAFVASKNVFGQQKKQKLL